MTPPNLPPWQPLLRGAREREGLAPSARWLQLAALAADVEAQARLGHWHALSTGGRALWGWPAPGAPLEDRTGLPHELDDTTPMPDHFHLLRISLNLVELLELSHHPHRRRRWRLSSDWQEEALNP